MKIVLFRARADAQGELALAETNRVALVRTRGRLVKFHLDEVRDWFTERIDSI
jgi:hypothetical protein